MGDLKLFKLDKSGVSEIPGSASQVEKTLQDLIERNLESFLGVRLLASEHTTGKVHGGRIDTLGIDENDSPVILEYKRSTNENVINQGLFYLDWLMDHRAELQLLTLSVLGAQVADRIDWSAPRVICIAGDFTRYDEHAVQQMGRNIELIRYRLFGDSLLALELVNTPKTITSAAGGKAHPGPKASAGYKTVSEYLEQAPMSLQDLYSDAQSFLLTLGDDVQEKRTKYYVAFRRLRNFACIEVHPQAHELLAFVKLPPGMITLEEGFTRDVSKIGHFGTGDLEIRIKDHETLERAKPLLAESYDLS
jgi:predicted transport protein